MVCLCTLRLQLVALSFRSFPLQVPTAQTSDVLQVRSRMTGCIVAELLFALCGEARVVATGIDFYANCRPKIVHGGAPQPLLWGNFQQ